MCTPGLLFETTVINHLICKWAEYYDAIICYCGQPSVVPLLRLD